MSICEILFSDDPAVKDDQGCRLPCGHSGPHEFIANNGETYQWETDWACDCEDCRSDDGDRCSLYWRVGPGTN